MSYAEQKAKYNSMKSERDKLEKRLKESEQRLEAERKKLEMTLYDAQIQLEYYKGFSDAVKLICGGELND